MTAENIDRIVDALEEFGNCHGTEAQLNKAVELRDLIQGLPTTEESTELEALGDRDGTEAQLNEVSSRLQADLAAMPANLEESYLQYPDVRLLLARYQPQEA